MPVSPRSAPAPHTPVLARGADPACSAGASARALLGMMRLAHELLASGRPIELAGIDQLTGRLCAQILDLPHDQGRTLRPQLQAALALADALAAQLRAPPPNCPAAELPPPPAGLQ